MPPRSLMSSLAFAALAGTASLLVAPQAQAQGLIDFLWGGEPGMGRQQADRIVRPEIYGRARSSSASATGASISSPRPGQAISYPIAVPREQSRWQGATTVSDKRDEPVVAADAGDDAGKIRSCRPGFRAAIRMNPLGVRAMYLGASTYRIHGTDAPWTIGQAVSKGCIRMFNEDVLDLYPRVPVGTKVTVTWQRFSSQAVASSDEPAPFDPMASAPAYKSPPRSIRQRTPSADAEMAADSYGEAAPAVDPDADDQALAAAAEKPIEPKPVKKAEVHKKHEATPAAARTA